MKLSKDYTGFSLKLSEVEQVRVARWIASGSARIPVYRTAQHESGKHLSGLLGFIEFDTLQFRPFEFVRYGLEPVLFFTEEAVEIGDVEDFEHSTAAR